MSISAGQTHAALEYGLRVTLELGVEQHLDPRARVLWLVSSLLPFLLLAPVVVVAASAVDILVLGLLALLFLAGVAAGVAAYISLRWRYWTFEVGADALVLRRGVYWKRTLLIPYFRVQQIDIVQNPLARILGYSSLLVSTASRQSDPVIPAINTHDAKELRLLLLRQVGTADAV